jgi:hypothetical protein
MKIQGGKPRSTQRLTIAEQAVERQSRSRTTVAALRDESATSYRVHHIASKRAHRGRGSNPYLP